MSYFRIQYAVKKKFDQADITNENCSKLFNYYASKH